MFKGLMFLLAGCLLLSAAVKSSTFDSAVKGEVKSAGITIH